MKKPWAIQPIREPDLSIDERYLQFWWDEGIFTIRNWGEYECYYFHLDSCTKSHNGKSWTGCFQLEVFEEQIKKHYAQWVMEKELGL